MEPATTETRAQEAERTPIPSAMKAAVIDGGETVAIHTVTRPEPGPGEVRVRVEGCGVCASDVPVWEGRPWFNYPQDPGASGHEGWGYVEAVGPDVDRVAVGDRVAALSYRAYAECDVARAAEVVKLPATLEDRPFPGEPLGCAVNVFRRSAIEGEQTVAVVGVGFLGALLVGLASGVGARVLAASRRPFALETARRFGAEETFSLRDDEPLVERVREMTDGDGCDCVIEATGKQEPLTLAGRLVRTRGRLVIAGYHQDGLRTVDMQRWNWRGFDVINAHERDPHVYVRGIREAVHAVASGRLDPAPLYTHVFSLDELSDAFHLLQERPDGFMKALIIP